MTKNERIFYFIKFGRKTRMVKAHIDDFLCKFVFIEKEKLNVSLISDNELQMNTYIFPKLFPFFINTLIFILFITIILLPVQKYFNKICKIRLQGI